MSVVRVCVYSAMLNKRSIDEIIKTWFGFFFSPPFRRSALFFSSKPKYRRCVCLCVYFSRTHWSKNARSNPLFLARRMVRMLNSILVCYQTGFLLCYSCFCGYSAANALKRFFFIFRVCFVTWQNSVLSWRCKNTHWERFPARMQHTRFNGLGRCC